MDWFYEINGQQLGPVSEEEIRRLVSAGQLNSQSLVWNATLPDWMPLASTALSALVISTAIPTQDLQLACCVECGKSSPIQEMVTMTGYLVCAGCKDRALDKVRQALPLGGSAWREGKQVVIADQSVLNDVCLKCGDAAGGKRLKRKFYWHSPFITLLFLLNVVIYIVVAMIVRKKIETEFGFCDGCKSRRRWSILIGWLLLLSAVGIAAVGAGQESPWAFVAIAPLLIGLIWFVVKVPVLRPKKIKDSIGWFTGAHERYLASLNEWRAP